MVSLSSLIPFRIRQRLRTAHRRFVFQRAMKRFLTDPAACLAPGNPVVRALIYGWGNELWSAEEEYLRSCIQQALASRGPILECGSGLSTIMVGAVAKACGREHVALEHTPAWAEKVQRYLSRYRLDSLLLAPRPLKDFGDFSWYDAPLEAMPARFSLVVCDGPPGTTRGGRYGLVPVMRDRLEPGCIILLDDAGRQGERAIARRWAAELGASYRVCGSTKPFIEMRVLSERRAAKGEA